MKKISPRTVLRLCLLCAVLTACGGQPAQPSGRTLNGVPTVTRSAIAAQNPTQTPRVATNTSEHPPQPAAFGQSTKVGHYTVVVHRVEQFDWLESAVEKRLFIDISIRNDSPDAAYSVWAENDSFAIVLPDGTPLNSAWFELSTNEGAAIGLFPKALQSNDCDSDGVRAGSTVRLFNHLMPGQVSRGWINFKLTPGVENPTNLLAVTLRQIDNAQPPPVLFQLTGTPKNDPLPWIGDTYHAHQQVTVEKVVFSSAKALPAHEPEEYSGWWSCAVPIRQVTLTIKNTDSRSVRINTPIYAVDAEGRVYREIGDWSRVGLEPQEEKDISLMFLSILGLEEAPVALLITPLPGSRERIFLNITE